jgi:sugar phosphate isomerase/epimerase
MQRALSTHVLVNHRLTTVWLDRIHQLGVPLVEIFCARQHFDYHDKAQVNELGYWFRDAELKLHSLHSPIYNDDCWGRSGPQSVLDLTEPSKPRRLEIVGEIKRALEVAEQIPCRYLIQHLGVSGQEWDDRAIDAAFTALEDLMLFARHRGVEILLENIPNHLSTAERLLYFVETTHLPLNFCLDTGHAHINDGLETAFNLLAPRLRSTHVHDNDGSADQHLFPLLTPGGRIGWKRFMELLRARDKTLPPLPLLLEVKDSPDFPHPLEAALESFTKLESL